MRNITLNADETLIKSARAIMKAEGTSLNAEFNQWLHHWVAERQHKIAVEKAVATLDRLQNKGYSSGGRKFTRDEMNER